ncbi:MAG: hypothetical protein ACYDCC_07660 [Actinomycetota bacterium]
MNKTIIDDEPLADLLWPQALTPVLPVAAVRSGSVWANNASRQLQGFPDPFTVRMTSRMISTNANTSLIESRLVIPLEIHAVGSSSQTLTDRYYRDSTLDFSDSDVLVTGSITATLRQTIERTTGIVKRATLSGTISTVVSVDIPKAAGQVTDVTKISMTVDQLSSTPDERSARHLKAQTLADDEHSQGLIEQALFAERDFARSTSGRFGTDTGSDLNLLSSLDKDVPWGQSDGVQVLVPSASWSPPGVLEIAARSGIGHRWCFAVLQDQPYINRVPGSATCPQLSETMTGWFKIPTGNQKTSPLGPGIT